MKIDLQYFAGCPNHDVLLLSLSELLKEEGLKEEMTLVKVQSIEEADLIRFLGSPTLRIESQDIEFGAYDRSDFGLKCRLYRSADGSTGCPPRD